MNKYAVMYSVGMSEPLTTFVIAIDELTARLSVFNSYPTARIYKVAPMPRSRRVLPEITEVIYVDFKKRVILSRLRSVA